jgi:kinesin family member C1
MNNKNVDTYLSIINDTLNSLQEDYDFMYESVIRKDKFGIDDRKYLIEEITNLKNKICELEENNIIKDNKLLDLGSEYSNVAKENYKKKLEEYSNKIRNYEIKIQQVLNERNEYKDLVKRLKNEIMDLKGSVRIFLRIKKSDNNSCIELINNTMKIFYNKKYLNFAYDRIFDPSDNQDNIFNEVQSIVESVYEGYKICLFVYGQTGSGKTYTMLGTNDDPGIMYRSFNQIFNLKKGYEEEGYSVNISCSCIEIYNEEIIDLFDTKKSKTNTERSIESFNEGYEIINSVSKLRRTESTSCNSQSSRSHMIFTLKLEIKNDEEIRNGSLCFIDLAGSERLNQSKVEGLRLKETQNINKSLSSLGDVFLAILRKDSHVPYRNSKLTFFLQEYLSGNSRVAMILNINGDQDYLSETVSTLRFGSKVSECKLGQVEKNVTKKLN